MFSAGIRLNVVFCQIGPGISSGERHEYPHEIVETISYSLPQEVRLLMVSLSIILLQAETK